MNGIRVTYLTATHQRRLSIACCGAAVAAAACAFAGRPGPPPPTLGVLELEDREPAVGTPGTLRLSSRGCMAAEPPPRAWKYLHLRTPLLF